MNKFHVCCLCLIARKDLLRITKEKESLVSSILHQELPKDVNFRAAGDEIYVKPCPKSKKPYPNGITGRSPFKYGPLVPLGSESATKVSPWISELNEEDRSLSPGPFSDSQLIDDLCEEVGEDTIKFFDESDEQHVQDAQESTSDVIQKTKFLQDDFNPDDYYDENADRKKHYKCPLCENYHGRQDFIFHRNVHLGSTPFKCRICFLEYSNTRALKKHMDKKH